MEMQSTVHSKATTQQMVEQYTMEMQSTVHSMATMQQMVEQCMKELLFYAYLMEIQLKTQKLFLQ